MDEGGGEAGERKRFDFFRGGFFCGGFDLARKNKKKRE